MGTEEIGCGNSRGYLVKKEVESPGLIKKNSCGISMGVGIWSRNLQGVYVTQFCVISMGILCFVPNF